MGFKKRIGTCFFEGRTVFDVKASFVKRKYMYFRNDTMYTAPCFLYGRSG